LKTVQHLLNLEMLPMHAVVLKELWNRQFPMLIACRGWSKTFTLAVFNLLRMVFIPKTKIVVCGSSFRQSKAVFEYMETIWSEAPVLRDIAQNTDGAFREVDRCTFRLNGSTTTSIPIGTGEKIRGLRASIVEADEFASISPDIFETVIVGFG